MIQGKVYTLYTISINNVYTFIIHISWNCFVCRRCKNQNHEETNNLNAKTSCLDTFLMMLYIYTVYLCMCIYIYIYWQPVLTSIDSHWHYPRSRSLCTVSHAWNCLIPLLKTGSWANMPRLGSMMGLGSGAFCSCMCVFFRTECLDTTW